VKNARELAVEMNVEVDQELNQAIETYLADADKRSWQ
jgi:hypothetical protein